MPTGLFDLRKLQVALEATAGTIVPATQQLIGRAQYTPQIVRDLDDFPRGTLIGDVGAGTLTRQGSRLVWETDLTYEEVIYPLLCGILDDAVPTGVGPYIWDFSRDWTLGGATKTASFEFVVDDGAAQHFEAEFGFAVCESFGISFAGGDESPAKLTSTWFGRAEQASVLTPALTPLTDRSPVAGELFGLWIDATWATLGTTQKTKLLKNANLQVETGKAPDFTTDARTDLDFSGVQDKKASATLTLRLNHNADGKAEVDAWRAGTARAIRLKATDGVKIVQIDSFGYYRGEPEFDEEDGQEVVSLELGIDYDATGADALNFQITNQIATQP